MTRVFIHGTFVGGGNEVIQLQDQGKLAATVSKVSILKDSNHIQVFE